MEHPDTQRRLRGAARTIYRTFSDQYAFGARGSGERRVGLLVIVIAIMGLADLALTLTYMKSTGMYELNPVARAMVAVGGEPQLIRFKLLTIALGAGMLYLLRRHRVVEPTAWGCAAVMCLLSAHWFAYNRHVENPAVWHGYQYVMNDEIFVTLDPAASRRAIMTRDPRFTPGARSGVRSGFRR